MEIIEINNEEYKKLVSSPFTRFEKAEFYALNASKVDEVKYLIFRDGKDRFAFVGGLKDDILKFPFSASFECFSEITFNNKINHYHDAVNSLLEWAKNNKINQIKISLPPCYYNMPHITKLENALFCHGFKQDVLDVNFEYYLSDFDENYKTAINYNARKSLNKSEKSNLSFEKTNDSQTVYEVIKQNREEKGYPLWMSYQDVIETSKIIPSDFFLVKDENNIPIASALVHQINDEILRVVYWGNIQESNKLCPMNFLSYNVFKYYSTSKFKIIDIGTSTENSVPNYGLCDFKEGIGCKCSLKPILIWDNKNEN